MSASENGPERHHGCYPRISYYESTGPVITKLAWCGNCGALWNDFTKEWTQPMGGRRDTLANLAEALRQTAKSIDAALTEQGTYLPSIALLPHATPFTGTRPEVHAMFRFPHPPREPDDHVVVHTHIKLDFVDAIRALFGREIHVKTTTPLWIPEEAYSGSRLTGVLYGQSEDRTTVEPLFRARRAPALKRRLDAVAVIALLSLCALPARAQTAPISVGPVQTSGPITATATGQPLGSVVSPQTVAAGEKLATDTQHYKADLAAGATADVLASDAAAVNADLSAVAAAAGVAQVNKAAGKYVLNLNIGGGGTANMAFPSKTGGTSIAGGGGAGLVLDLGIGTKTDATDHFHIALTLGVTSLTASTPASEGHPAATSTVGAFMVALTPAWLPVANAPEYGLGPILACPLASSAAIGKSCIVGLTFTTSLAGVVKQFVPGA